VATARPEPTPFTVEADGLRLAGEAVGEGRLLVLLHGLTATRRYVVHGSLVLPRGGYRVISYDARAHGASDPAPEGQGYSYAELAADLAAVIEAEAAGSKPVLVGHSMGAHTLARLALERSDELAGVVLIGPTFMGTPLGDDAIAYWNALADGLERDGVEGFLAAYEAQGLDPEWKESLLRITRERLQLQEHPKELARALREVPPSRPLDDLSELEFLDLPALLVASGDEADPGHPYAVAEEWARLLPNARLVSEPEGASPLAWQGGRLSREIASFCETYASWE
jgi:pimeloyl-ACP methyl ester carboxylesterase